MLLVGSMLFWSVALGSGALSLLAVTGFSATSDELGSAAEAAPTATAAEPLPGHAAGESGSPILIHLQESAEPEDVNDNLGAVAPAEADQSDQPDRLERLNDDGTGRLPGQAQASDRN
jgi:hypothetical protein